MHGTTSLKKLFVPSTKQNFADTVRENATSYEEAATRKLTNLRVS